MLFDGGGGVEGGEDCRGRNLLDIPLQIVSFVSKVFIGWDWDLNPRARAAIGCIGWRI